ncbi:retention module-containing protein, partial [Azovibrio restrictus]|uniref:retention module-containing protein n=1 Tax=Azovibrio restrictus TaxID=146938 RepID=UPI00047B9B41
MAQVIAKIVFVSGEAFIRDGAGNSRRARAGEPLREGETLVTGSGAQVQVAFEDGRDMVLGSNQTLFLDVSVAAETKPDATDSALLAGSGDVDKIVQALNEGGDLDAVVEDTAAGAAGSAGDSGHSFVRLMRITETVDPLEFQFETPGGTGEAQLAATVENIPPIVVEGVSSPISLEGEDLVFLVTLSGETREPTSFTLLLTDITAAFGEDYTGSLVFTNGVTYDPLTGLVTVPAGVDGFSVSVPTVEENVFEPDEGLTLTVGGVVGTGTIVNNDAPPEVVSVDGSDPAINGVLVPEGDVAVFTVTLSNPSSTPTVFALSLVNGSALLGSDYAAGMSFSNGVTFDPATGLITIPPGVADFTVSVPTLDDNVYEGNETFGLTVGGVTGTGTIVDDADIPAIIRVGAADPALDGVVVPEGTTAVFTVEMSNPSLLDTVFDLNLTSGTATLGLDFTNALSFSNGVSYDAATGKITVPAGVTSFTVAVPTTDDTIYEQPETFNLQVGGVTGIGTITDNDEAPVVTHVGGAGGSIDSVTVPEGAAAAFTVSLSNASSTPSTFALTLAGGTALMGADFTGEMAFSNGVTYNAATGLVTVPPGVVSFQVVVPTVDDSVFEPTEQFTLSVGGVTGVGTITDNDLKPSVTHVGGDDPNVDSVTVTEGTTAVFTVNLSQASNAPMTLTFALMDGSAALGVDYTDGLSFSSGVVYANGSIVVPAGVTSFTVSVPTLNDSLAEPTEQFSLAVGGVTGTGIILDNDGGTPGVPLVTHVGDGAGLNNVTVSEGDA